jgi:toxin ParE1/3/4
MKSAKVSNAAQRDLERIHAFVAQDNPEAANQVFVAILDRADRLALAPQSGHVLKRAQARHKHVRWTIVTEYPNYLIFYRPIPAGIQVVRGLHAAQDWTRFFSSISDWLFSS